MDMHEIGQVEKRYQQVDLYVSTDMNSFNQPPDVSLLITLPDGASSCDHWRQVSCNSFPEQLKQLPESLRASRESES